MWPVMHCAAVLAFVLLSVAPIVSASDQLYRCADGTFTNKAERQCAPYEAKGIVRVQGETAEATKQPFAEVKVFGGSAKTTDK
jgi:hypothetical protein